MKNCAGVSAFADDYDAFLLDIWGVIHDGTTLYPGVVETLHKLKSKKIIFISNAPRRAHKVKRVLTKFGISPDLYSETISSGEVAYSVIKRIKAKNYFYIGPEKDADLLDGLNLKQVAAVKADFAVATGFDNDDSTLAEKLPQIEEALKYGLKLYCVNPDKIVVRQNGTKMLCAGIIGEYYAEKGGKVEFIGKPYKTIYNKCFELLEGIPKQKIVAIGDNLDTDILGANNAGMASILCLGGVLQAEQKSYLELIEESKIRPQIVIPKFSW